MLDVNKYINKLVQALDVEGKHYNVWTKRYYSSRLKRYITKYTVQDAEDERRTVDVYNKVEVLKLLVREFSEATGREVPESCKLVLEAKPVKEKKERKKRGSIILD